MGAVVLSAYLRSQRTERWLNQLRVRQNAASGVLACLQLVPAQTNDRVTVDLFGSGTDTVLIDRAGWGLFDICDCQARKGGQQFRSTAVVAARWPRGVPSLWVSDLGEPLSLAGNSRITGPAFLPAAGIRRGYIEGRPLQGECQVSNARSSDRQLPDLPIRLQRAIQSALANLGSDWTRTTWASLDRDSLDISFSSPALVVSADDAHVLGGRHLCGHIVILSSDTIRLNKTLSTENILVIAPFIQIDEGFQGSLQCFTTKGLHIGRGVRLQYPSVLVCHPDEANYHPCIRVAENVEIEGVLIGWSGRRSADPVLIELNMGAVFMGEIWNDGPVQLRGHAEGLIMAEQFILRTPSAVYRNCLLDAVVQPMTEAVFAATGIWEEAPPPVVLIRDEALSYANSP